ncbi:Manganese transport system membrane protein MntD [Candidatus Rhabdochlamydia oedothoracis]|uniref:Manganese transport system membrane protein MntD n=1 Tax=Candidatus Rhabdochlamydia oedothoracis TaxID=2720720 RepID=A0ABX8V7J1_9BACT|nr:MULTISPECIES: metal ABC transporter permease [Rhabdochlamydia]KAG6559328.1 Manganese transport system membrane protein MntB [Candidatus Rhabdochlamydia sp. W815]MCL6756112.1 metal ABC transporter permease [Candidatus Rhabdochlamydia oedothoracis]QYF49179.1 Manganese transport system membrane protein MntD [Candidatus Rhabdochlamydia oedothoracis]
MNPYFAKDFFSFFAIFIQRLFLFFSGQLSMAEIVSDELQIFVLSLISCTSAIVGSLLVLKKSTMLANSLSHTVLLGISVAYLMVAFFSQQQTQVVIGVYVLLLAAFITAILTTVLTQFLIHSLRLQEDASIGLIFTLFFALGVTIVTMYTKSTHLGIEAVMGNVDALHLDDLKLISWVVLLDIFVVGIFFKEFKMVIFDPCFATVLGVRPSLFHYLLMGLTAATVIGAFRAVGVLLVLSLLVGPVLIARIFTKRLKPMIFYSCMIGSFSSLLSVAMARHLLSVHDMSLSTAGLVVFVITVIYSASLLFIKIKRSVTLSRLAKQKKYLELR